MIDMSGWRQQYMTRLKESGDEFSSTQSVTILQNMFIEFYEEAHAGRYSRTNWQATVPAHLLNTKGLSQASSWLVQRIEALTFPTTSAG